MGPELEACFVQTALILGTRKERRDGRARARLRTIVARHFKALSDTLPPIEHWPARLHGRMSDNEGKPLDVWERLATAYIWWIDHGNNHVQNSP